MTMLKQLLNAAGVIGFLFIFFPAMHFIVYTIPEYMLGVPLN